MFEVLTYTDDQGEKPYANWLAKLADRHAKARVLVRVIRMTGGDKRKQQVDIDAAVGYWNDWKRKNAK